ncbi:hypothetical protein DPX16_16440 [Anabarilius grahami]|uniref:Uncharacterized protein n=1 Tax=Anabarilius grahami TaxID=495550 RepID=A0A3N0XXK2_ANAGA|nr:hypothetical protein DPX16_16440 [Anabarilius grahami]
MTGSEHLQNCSSCGVFPVCSGQYLSKGVQGRNSGEPATGHGRPRLTDARGERRLAHVVQSNRRATVAQIAQEVNAGSDRKRHPVWASDVKPIRGTSPQTPRRALQLQDSLFSKELENMGKHLAEVEKDLAKLAEQGKLNRSPNSPHRSLLLTPLFHTTNTLPVLGQTSRPQSPSSLSTKTTGLPLHNTKPTSLVTGRISPSNPSSRAQTPSGARTPSRPLTPNSLMMRSFTAGSHGNPERLYGRSRSRPDEFYQQLQAVRKPWRIPGETESDCLEPPEQDKCNPSGVRDASKRSVFSGKHSNTSVHHPHRRPTNCL